MKKLFYLCITVLAFLSCDNESINGDSPEDLTFSPERIVKNFTYVFEDIEYSVKVDYTDIENPLLLDGPDNAKLALIFEQPNLAIVSIPNDDKKYLFENEKAYKETLLYKSRRSNKGSLNQIPRLSSEKITYFYKRGGYKYSGGGFSLTGDKSRSIPNFHNIVNSSSSYVGNIQLFPSSWYNIGYRDINDDVSSIKVNNMYLQIYEHTNYGGASYIFDAVGGSINWRDLNDYHLYACGFFCGKDWNDRISSAKGQPF